VSSIWRLNNKRLALCASFGGAALALRALNVMIPIGGPFVLDLRGIPGIVGAALTGPVGGLIIGVLAGVPAKFPMVDIPSFGMAYFLVGFAVTSLSKHKWLGGFMVLFGHAMAAVIAWAMGLVSSLPMSLALVLPRAAIEVPIQMVLLYTILKRWPNCPGLT
jgi:hypothetical protein